MNWFEIFPIKVDIQIIKFASAPMNIDGPSLNILPNWLIDWRAVVTPPIICYYWTAWDLVNEHTDGELASPPVQE